ncbi:MAG: glycosyltransferase [Bacteroidota bacterium]
MIWLGVVFCLVAGVQVVYYFFAYSRKTQFSSNKQKDISIIVCARNEAENLRAHIPLWLGQSVFGARRPTREPRRTTTTDSELIIVNDYSTDETAEVVGNFCGADSPVRLLRPPEPTRPGKKDALAYAISQARNACLLLTDADCRPASDRWAKLMTAPLHDGAALVVGHGAYDASGGSWVGRWQVFAAEHHGLQYRTLTSLGWTKLGVGRNLAYTKDFFYARNGMEAHTHLAGGDDDLLLQTSPMPAVEGASEPGGSYQMKKKTGRPAEVQKNDTVAVIDHPHAWTFSKPAFSWMEYAARKHRHFSVGRHYTTRSQLILTGLALSHGLFYLLGFLLLFTSWRWWALGIYALRMLLVWRAHTKRSAMLPIYDALLCFYLVWQVIVTVLARPRQMWEERQPLKRQTQLE